MKPYDYRNCSSLFGYAKRVHIRSGAACALCGLSVGDPPDPAIFRQLSIEHIIGASQGGYPDQIREAVRGRFPWMRAPEQERLASDLHEANTVTACSFCNSSTSRECHNRCMQEIIQEATGEVDELLRIVTAELQSVLDRKRVRIRWILSSVEAAFYDEVAPWLGGAPEESGRLLLTEQNAHDASRIMAADSAFELTSEDEAILNRFWARMSSERMVR